MIPYTVASGSNDTISHAGAELGGAHLIAGSTPASLVVYDNLGADSGTILYELGAPAGEPDSTAHCVTAQVGARTVLTGTGAVAILYMR